MITLNIAPNTLKQEAKYDGILKKIQVLLLLVIASLIFYTLILLIALFFSTGHLASSKSQAFVVTKTTEDYTKKLNEIEDKIGAVTSIQEEYVEWSKFFNFLSQNYSGKISFSSISINKTDGTIKLSGKAQDRNGLLSLQKNLENSGLFEEVVLPFSSLVKEVDIDFQIIAKFKHYEFNNI